MWKRVPVSSEEIERYTRAHKRRARFLVDENQGAGAAETLRDAGWNAKFVSDFRLRGRDDSEVYEAARREDRVLLTHDGDFLDDRRFPPHRKHPGVVVLPGA